MTCCLLQWFLIVIVHFIDAFCLLILGTAADRAFLHSDISDINTVICLIGNTLCNNIPGTLQCFPDICNTLISIHIFFCFCFQRLICILLKDKLCKRLQPLFLCHTGSCFSLWSVGSVQIFHHHESLRRQDLGLQLLSKLSLLLNTAKHLLLLLLQITEIVQSFI